jgi:hypothetical protein
MKPGVNYLFAQYLHASDLSTVFERLTLLFHIRKVLNIGPETGYPD